MAITKVALIIIPFLFMTMVALVQVNNIDQPTELQFSSENVTVNDQQSNFDVEPISMQSITQIAIIVGISIAVCIAMGVHVLGSGISGSVIPIVFMVTILTPIYILLSGLSFQIFASIPIFGIPFFFGLVLCYIVGIATFGSGSGGD